MIKVKWKFVSAVEMELKCYQFHLAAVSNAQLLGLVDSNT